MTSKERIYKILDFKTPDRIGVNDIFLDTTIEKWEYDGLPENISPEEYFDLDFELIDLDKISSKNISELKLNKFTCISFSEPFQRLCNIYGREETLKRLAAYPERLQTELIRETGRIIDSLRVTMRKGLTFDGAWIWGDLAYKDGLFFSISYYKRNLLPLHKKIFQFLNSQNLFILFHSDGKISDLIPYLLDAGVRALHPLEENSGMDICRLIKTYKDRMVFMGHMDIERLIANGDNFKEMRKRIDMLKKNSYIYNADYPIMPNISFTDYNNVMKVIKECGAY